VGDNRSFPDVLTTLLERRDLSDDLMRSMMREFMSGRGSESEAAAFLVAMRMKGESCAELAAAAEVMREHMVRWDPGCAGVLDTCGTGGDGTQTFNISTAVALVLAGAGVPVVKHGNRSVSSRSGSADVLAELGMHIEGNADFAHACLKKAGFAFCFAPRFHPALAHVAAVRRRLGVSTLFNCLGPLANPAGAPFQLLGVGRLAWLDLMAGALARLGTQRAFLVHAIDGLDEVSLSSPTLVREVRGHDVQSWEWRPDDFGLEPCRFDDLCAADAVESARMVIQVVDGVDGPARRVVLANAAAGLLITGLAATLPEGVRLAAAAIDSGRTRKVLDTLRAMKPT
jgi:anthranilate phosphoribosyltransferase